MENRHLWKLIAALFLLLVGCGEDAADGAEPDLSVAGVDRRMRLWPKVE